MKHLVLSTLLICASTLLMAFTPKIHFYGYVMEGDLETIFQKNKAQDQTLNEVWVEVTCDGEVLRTMQNRQTGFFSLILEVGKRYEVSFRRHGFITKTFEIDGSEVPQKDFSEAFKLFTDITLFKDLPMEDVKTLSSAPVARCKFNDKRNNMSWDMDYAKIAFDHFLRVTGVDKGYALRN